MDQEGFRGMKADAQERNIKARPRPLFDVIDAHKAKKVYVCVCVCVCYIHDMCDLCGGHCTPGRMCSRAGPVNYIII